MKQFNVELIIPGHGEIIDDTHELDRQISFFEYMREFVIENPDKEIKPSDLDIPKYFESSLENRFPSFIELFQTFYQSQIKGSKSYIQE